MALQCFHQRAKIAVTGKQHDLIDMLGEFKCIDRKLDVHVAFHFAAAAGVGEFFGRLGDDGVAVVVEPVDQRPDRREFLILDNRRVVERPKQRSTGLEFREKAFVVDVEAEQLRGRMQIRPID